ncbi:MAG: FAD:protein FMN transferase [Sulfurovum sp.]|nr:FAD:protein FMN transferase [Sulfurovum sp.]
MKIYATVLLVLLLSSFILANPLLQTRTQVIMGTFASLSLTAKDAPYMTPMFVRLQEIENALSSYNPLATLAQLNLKHQIPIDADLVEVLQQAQALYHESEGYFDISIGTISKDLYHFGEENIGIPSQEALSHAYIDIKGIEMNATHIRTPKRVTLDLGGIGKGYGIDALVHLAKEANITEGILALSGDIHCLHSCSIEIQSPFTEATFAKVTSQKQSLSLSTSGTYRRYAHSQDHHHLINPKTKTQGKDFVSVSLFALDNNTKLDALSTAIAVMPKSIALAFLARHTEIGFILVDKEGDIYSGNTQGLITIEYLDRKPKQSQE